MEGFSELYSGFLSEFGRGRKMVLSSSLDGVVTSRMVSVVQLDGLFYFQTDKLSRKYPQLIQNPNAALCIDNIQIEGVSEDIGHPLECAAFCELYKACYSGSYEMYTSLKNERLFVVRPVFIERWLYKDGVPYIEVFDIQNQVYELTEYKGK